MYLPLLLLAAATSGAAPNVTTLRVPDNGVQPQVAVDRGGTVHMVYLAGDPKSADVYYVRAKDGVAFSRPMRVNSQAGSAIGTGTIRGAQIALGRNGLVHIAWDGSQTAEPRGPVNPDSKKAGEPMLYARMNEAGTGFEPQRNLMTRSFGLDGGGSVAADDAGNVYVAWHGKALEGAPPGEAGRAVWIAKSADDGRTFAAESAAWSEPTGACGCCQLKAFASRSGGVYILYRSATVNVHRDIYLLSSTDRGKSFQGRLLHKWEINACPMSSMAFAESAAGAAGPPALIAAWETNGQVYWQNIARGGAPVGAPGAAKGRKHPTVAMNARGEVLLGWTEGTGWQRGGSLAWQSFDAAGGVLGEWKVTAGVPVWGWGAAWLRPDGGFGIAY